MCIKKNVGRKRGRSARPASPSAPPVEALDHEYRRDWEDCVSGQENVLILFSGPELLGLAVLSPRSARASSRVLVPVPTRICSVCACSSGSTASSPTQTNSSPRECGFHPITARHAIVMHNERAGVTGIAGGDLFLCIWKRLYTSARTDSILDPCLEPPRLKRDGGSLRR